VPRVRGVRKMAFNQAILARAVGWLVPAYFIAVNKKEPFRCGVSAPPQLKISVTPWSMRRLLNVANWIE
jgi:predicted transglutaminase-like cysteine proteinase